MGLLSGKSVAVIGATGGIGSDIVASALGEGASVHAIGRDAARLGGLAGNLASRSTLDLSQPEGWPQVIEALPALDGIVVCSGKLDMSPFRTLSPAKLEESLQVNVMGPAMLTKSLLRSGKLAPSCSVVFIGSIAGIRAIPGNLSYATAKSALRGLVRNLALELAPRRIRVNLVSPGLVLAGMGVGIRDSLTEAQIADYAKGYPLGLGASRDVSGPVLYLLSEHSRWVTGQDHVVDGGATIC